MVKMHKKNYFLKIFFIFLSIFSLIKIYDHSINLETFQYGEWLINYQYGFVRRGIIGELIYSLSLFFGGNIQISFFIILSIFCLFYYLLNYRLLKNVKLNFINYLILFSPLFYLFFIVISKVGIRKEIIFYIYYLSYLIYLSSSKFTFKKNWIYIFLYPILLLNHEGVYFFLPYIILPLLFLKYKKNYKKILFQSIILFIFSTSIMILIYINKGSYDHTIQICQSLGEYAPHKCDWWGPIIALSREPLVNIENVNMNFFYLKASLITWFGFLFYIIYSFAPLILFFYFCKKNYKNIVLYVLFYILVLLFSLPLFHIAEDWSRWFSIHFHLLAFLVFFFQRLGFFTITKNSIFFKFENFFMNGVGKICFIFFLFIYSTVLHHHYFFFKGVKLESTYYKVFNKLKKNSN